MNAIFSRWLPCATLSVWSAILLHFYFSGRIVNTLHPTFRPGVLLAGIVMLALALVFIFAPAKADDCCSEEGCAQPLARMKLGRILTFAILILPLAGATVVAPQGFSANTILNRGIALSLPGVSKPAPQTESASSILEPPLPTRDGSQPAASASTDSTDQFIPKTPSGNLAVQVIDLLYAAQDADLRKTLENKTVELTGQLKPETESNASGNRFKLVRMFMTCCAADAQPIAALVEGTGPTNIPEMEWIKIVGKATFPFEGGRNIAVVKADSVVKTAPPEETMLY